MNPSAATLRAPEVRADTLLDDGSACDTFATRRGYVTTDFGPCQHFFARKMAHLGTGVVGHAQFNDPQPPSPSGPSVYFPCFSS